MIYKLFRYQKYNFSFLFFLTSLEPVQSWEIDGENMDSERLYFLGLQNHCRW